MKKPVLFFLVALFCAANVEAQINAMPRELRHDYVAPDQIVTIASNTPFNQAISILDSYSRKFLKKIIVDPENRTGAIGVDVDRMQWLDAFESILRANNLWYKEYDSYIQITSGKQQTPTVAGTVATQAALPPGTPTLDSREVKIQAIFFEADLTKLNQHGINLNYLLSGSWNGITSMSSGNLPTGVSTVPPTLGLNAPNVGDITASGQYGFSFGTIGAIFSLLQSEDMGKILASPQIAVRSGEAGHIQVGVNFFVTTKDFAGNTVQTMQNAGIIINATPTVYSQDSVDFVALTLDLTNSSLAGNATTGTIINTEQATTKVLLLNGEQTTIGGLYSTTTSSHREGIPVLKDLPWWVLGIRYLTGSETMTTQTKELIILIKADILPTLKDRFETLMTKGPQPQKSVQEQLRQLENEMKQLDPTVGK